MESFREYYETIEEGVVLDKILKLVGTVLGLGTAGVAGAWATALLLRGGTAAVNSIAKTLGRNGISFKKKVREMENSPAVKQQENRMAQIERKYSEEIEEVVAAIRAKNPELAGQEFRNLPRERQASTEIKQIIVKECIKAYGEIPVSEPSPGNTCYQAIKRTTDLATAKAASSVYKEQMRKFAEGEI